MSYVAIHHPEAIFCFGSAAVNALIEFFRARDFNQILVRLRGWWVKPMGTPNLEILSSNTLLDLCSQNQEATKKLKMRMQDTSNQASGLRTVLETMLLNFPRAKKDQKNKYNNILNYIDIYFIYHLNGYISYIIWDIFVKLQLVEQHRRNLWHMACGRLMFSQGWLGRPVRDGCGGAAVLHLQSDWAPPRRIMASRRVLPSCLFESMQHVAIQISPGHLVSCLFVTCC
jgi:hypothetical protein